jgi:hypothetical protein
MNGQENETMDLARWSGLGMLLEVGGMDKCLEHFAKLVAAKEREACAKVCDALHYEVDAYGAQCAAAIRART